jgi:hypothetical protein
VKSLARCNLNFEFGHMKKHHLATVTCQNKRASAAHWEEYRRELEQRLHEGLDRRCVVIRRGRRIFIGICGDFTEPQLDHLAQGVARIWEWEAA